MHVLAETEVMLIFKIAEKPQATQETDKSCLSGKGCSVSKGQTKFARNLKDVWMYHLKQEIAWCRWLYCRWECNYCATQQVLLQHWGALGIHQDSFGLQLFYKVKMPFVPVQDILLWHGRSYSLCCPTLALPIHWNVQMEFLQRPQSSLLTVLFLYMV